MKRLEKLAIVLTILWLVGAVFSTLTPICTKRMLAQEVDMSPMLIALSSATILTGFMTAAICGVWLFFESKRENYSPWVWCFVGLIFNKWAVIIFFAYIILKELRNKNPNKSSEPIL